MTYVDTLLIRRDDSLLVQADSQGLRLPSWHYQERHFWQACAEVNANASELLGCKVFTLRCFQLIKDNELLEHFYELELLAEVRSAHAWLDINGLDQLNLEPRQRAVVEAYLNQVRDESAELPAWSGYGFSQDVQDWLRPQLEASGLSQTADLEQLRSWERASVIAVPVGDKRHYFKAQPAMFSHDLSLMRFLNAHIPDDVPTILADDERRGWQLIAEMPGRSLTTQDRRGTWMEVCQHYGRLQGALMRFDSELLAMGIPDRRLPVLYARLDVLFADLEAYPALTPSNIASLRQRLPEFKQICQQLYAYPIPAALEHGDLWWGNIFINEQKPIFFDWSDASLTHPFFGIAMLLQEDLADVFDEADLNAIKRSYFVTFRSFGSEAVLDKAMAMASVLAPLHFASHYHDLILPQLEARWQLEGMVPYFLNKLLTADHLSA